MSWDAAYTLPLKNLDDRERLALVEPAINALLKRRFPAPTFATLQRLAAAAGR